MIILELACFGLRSLRQVTKLTLKPGVNLIHGRTGTGKTTLWECLGVLLLGAPPDRLAASAAGVQQPAQAAITVKLRSGAIYRVAQDFAKNAFHILRWDANTKAFVSESTDRSALEALWQAECDGLSLETLRPWVAWSPQWTPPRSSDDALPDFTGAAAPTPAVMTAHERTAKVSRLAELTGALARAEQTAQFAEERGKACDREAQARNRIAALEGLQARQRASAEREPEMKPFLQGPQDIDKTIDAYLKALPAAQEERAALEEDLAGLAAELDETPRPFVKAPLFVGGAAVTVLSFLIAAFVPLAGWYQHLYLAGLAAGLGLLIAALVLDFRRIGRRKSLEARRTDLTRKLARVDDRLKKTYAAPIALMTQTGCANAETFKAKRRAALEWAAEQERFGEEEARLLGGATRESLDADWHAAKAAAETLSQEAGEDVDIDSLRDAIGLLTRELDGAPAAPNTVESGPPSPSQGAVDLLRAHTSEINVCLLRVSEERLEIASASQGNGVMIRRRGENADSALERLSGGEAVQARLAVALGAWAARRTGLGLPLILDDPLSGLDPQSRLTVVDTMTHLVGDRQIILFGNAPLPDVPGLTQLALPVR